MAEESEFLTTSGVCKYKGWSRGTLYNRIRQGLVIQYKTPGMGPRYRLSELTEDALMNRAMELGLTTKGNLGGTTHA